MNFVRSGKEKGTVITYDLKIFKKFFLYKIRFLFLLFFFFLLFFLKIHSTSISYMFISIDNVLLFFIAFFTAYVTIYNFTTLFYDYFDFLLHCLYSTTFTTTLIIEKVWLYFKKKDKNHVKI